MASTSSTLCNVVQCSAAGVINESMTCMHVSAGGQAQTGDDDARDDNGAHNAL